MRPRTGVIPFLRIATLLLGCAPLLPATLEANSLSRRPHAAPGPGVPDDDIVLPDVPPARVVITPSDLSPEEDARRILSRLVVRPGVVLQTYAPLKGAGQTRSRSGGDAFDPLGLPRQPSDVTGAVAAVPSSRGPADLPPAPPAPPKAAETPAAPADAPARKAGDAQPPAGPPATAEPIARPAADARPAPVEARTPRDDLAVPGSAVQSADQAAPSVAAPPAPALAAVLDADVLQKALRTYVEADMTGIAGPLPARAEARRAERQRFAAVYEARHFAPLWIEDGRFNAAARAVLSRIDHAAEDGLDLSKVQVNVPKAGADAAALAESELSLSFAAIAYAQQATGSRLDPSRIAPLIAAKPEVAEGPAVMAALAASTDPAETLRGFNPPQPGYALLREKLAELRQKSDLANRESIPYGKILKPGMKDARVPLLRTRFGLDIPAGAPSDSGLVYDTKVAAAVADFQRAHGLPPSGVLTTRTIAALSGGNPRRLEAELVANMERWRWLPRDLGDERIVVNIPDFTLDLMHGDASVHHARVVVGQPDKPTPVFSNEMKFIIVNPYWNVPLSIVQKEMLPKLAADPNYFTNHGYETVERNGQTYVRQPPGDANALGRIKFMFPNKFSVYLHDTNARSLFGKEERALSHGCVRVDQPFRLAAAVLGPEHGWSEARVKKLIGGGERTINLPRPLPIHIVYFTAFVDGTGALRLRDDVYGYSAKVRAALGLEG